MLVLQKEAGISGTVTEFAPLSLRMRVAAWCISDVTKRNLKCKLQTN
jgi:hypothetical protein